MDRDRRIKTELRAEGVMRPSEFSKSEQGGQVYTTFAFLGKLSMSDNRYGVPYSAKFGHRLLHSPMKFHRKEEDRSDAVVSR